MLEYVELVYFALESVFRKLIMQYSSAFCLIQRNVILYDF